MLTRFLKSIAVERKPPRLPDATLDRLGQGAQMSIAGIQFGPGVADANDRASVKDISGEPLVTHPTAMDKAVLVGAAKPGPGP
jgi:hypothetical protein